MKQRRRIADIAVQRIGRLFELAEAEARARVPNGEDDRREERSDRYIQLVCAIGMRYRVQIPGYLKRRVCKGCYALLIPGRNARVRLRGEYITATCLRCGKQMRRPYKAARSPSVRRRNHD